MKTTPSNFSSSSNVSSPHIHNTPPLASSVADLLHTHSCTEGNGDSGSSGHFLPIACEDLVLDIRPATAPIRVTCPDGSIMVSTKTAVLNLPHLPLAARTCHMFPNINGALLSIGKFCDNNMTAHFDDSTVEIRDKATHSIVLTGRRDNRGMYMIPLVQSLPSTAPSSANASIYSLLSTNRSCAKRVDFVAKAFGNPTPTTLIAAAKSTHLHSIPNFTYEHARNFAPDSIESAKGHLDRAKQGTWSRASKSNKSRKQTTSSTTGNAAETYPVDDSPISANAIYVASVCSSTLHGDLTGRYHVTSRTGNTKVLIGYSSDGRFIKSVPVKGDSADDLIKGFDTLIKFFQSRGIVNELVRIDNQTSTDLETYFEKVAKIKYRYVPPGNHRTLHAERDIRTFKNHFVACRAGVDKSFPANLWDELLDQVDLTLNVLRPCGNIANTSAWDYTCGAYDYKTHPIGPVGAKVLVYESPEERTSFADHGIEGFYVGPAWKHYRCFRVWIPSTQSFRISDTLSWHLHDPFGLLSNHSATDSITDAITALEVALHRCTVIDNDCDATTASAESLRRSIDALNLIQHSPKSSGTEPLPRVVADQTPAVSTSRVTTPTPTTSLPRVVISSNSPVSTTTTVPRVANPSRNLRSTKHQAELTQTVSLPRVVIPTPVVPSNASAPTATPRRKIANTSRNLRSNKHHILIDPNPIMYNLKKVVGHTGSETNPLKPLRFRIRWEDTDSSQDTMEPWEHIEKSQPAVNYVQAHSKLWYLLEPTLLANQALNRKEVDLVGWWKSQKTYIESPPLTRERAEQIAQAVRPETVQLKRSMYYMLAMPFTADMTCTDFAFAAGDMDDDGEELKYKSCIKGPDKEYWIQASIKEFHKLFKQYNTMRPIKLTDIPEYKRKWITYYNPQCKTKMKPDGKQYRVRGTFGGNKPSGYTGITASYQASMTTVKILLNKTISQTDSKWMTMDVTDMYLNTRLPLDQWEYMVLDVQDVPQEIIDTYNLNDYMSPGDTKVYLEVMGALYGMKQAGYLAHLEILEHLANHGYTPCPNTPCLFKHHTDDIEFTLITDDFGVRYGNKAAADKLLAAMSQKYPMTHDWTGNKYAGFDILIDYAEATKRVEISMKGYIAAVLKRFKHVVNPTQNAYSPEIFTPINYGSKESQLTKPIDESPVLSATDINLLQQITGCMLYYVRGVDATMLLGVDHISREQSKGTQETMSKATRLLEYAATFPDATIVYYPSDMVLIGNVDGSYNSEPEARSRAALFTYLGRTTDPNFVNGPIECLTTIIPTVVSSAAETEYASLFIGGKALLPLRYNLLDMDCIQPPTVLITDNVAAKGIATNTCKQRRSKSMDMRYHWIRDRVELKDFEIAWRPGSDSIADYLTKIQPVSMVLKMRHFFVKPAEPAFKTSAAKRQFLKP